MKKYWLILLIAILGCSKAELPVTPDPDTTLEVIAIDENGTTIDSAKVFLDGSIVGMTPFNSRDIQPGLHALRVTQDGYKIYSEHVLIEESRVYAIEAVLTHLPPDKGQLFITVNLDSALVQVKDANNALVVESFDKAMALTLLPGTYEVTGEKTGCPKVTAKVTIYPEKTTIVNLELALPGAIPPSLQFAIVEDTVKVGDEINLNWRTNGTQVIIDQGVGTRGPSGSEKLISRTAGLKVFTATAYSADNLTTQLKDSVYVHPVNKIAPSLSFSIDKDSVMVGDVINLNWQTDGTRVIIDQGIGTRGPSGSEKLICRTTGLKVFTATAYSADNLTTQLKDSVYVHPVNKVAPSLSFSIEQDSVIVGEEILLEWQSDGVRVIIDQGVGVRGPIGSDKFIWAIPGRKIFTATAYSKNNLTTVKKDTVFINPAPNPNPPQLDFYVVQDSVEFGEAVLVEWQSDGVQVIVDQGIGIRGPNGSDEINFANPGKKVFTATAYSVENLLTVKKDSVYIKEASLPPHPVVMLSTTRLVTVNTPATINWQSQNANYIVVDYVDNAALSGSKEIIFISPGIRIVTATAFNMSGYASTSDTIEVVEPVVEDPVDDILISVHSVVRVDQGEEGMEALNAATFEIKKTGFYKVLAEVWYNSGDEQLNESYYIDISDNFGRKVLPQDFNAGVYKVVPDEPGEPHTNSRDSGAFKLFEGTNSINIYHYAIIASMYPQFVNNVFEGPESVHILGFKIKYISK